MTTNRDLAALLLGLNREPVEGTQDWVDLNRGQGAVDYCDDNMTPRGSLGENGSVYEFLILSFRFQEGGVNIGDVEHVRDVLKARRKKS
jgi:hypothetical protein